ncbi:macrophage mannose receptor 1-like [Eucyclogobius newberryi]|uniref:macrophage mannose receptor 1-like n=1 Tax=Eucyclogobius newberryi TaxID=166745 RepID=UPI003B5A5AE7
MQGFEQAYRVILVWLQRQLPKERYWIGLTDQYTEGVWEWSDGSALPDHLLPWIMNSYNSNNKDCGQVMGEYWMPGEPNGANGKDCGQSVGSSYWQWSAEDCNVKRRYICKRNQENWFTFGSNSYLVKANRRLPWTLAREDCLREGADLVSISSQKEGQYIAGRLNPFYGTVWIGLSTLVCDMFSCTRTRREAGNTEFAWSDAQTMSYQNWGWQSFGGSCYWLVNSISLMATWNEASTECYGLRGHLLIINSQEEQFFINEKLPDFQGKIPDIWVGLSDMYQDGEFKWVDTSPIDFSNFAPGFPKNTEDIRDCGQIYTVNGNWETTNCFKRLGYICERTGGPQATRPDIRCDAGYLLYRDFCYHFEKKKVMNWHNAETYCIKEQGHLVSFHSEEELSFIRAYMHKDAWTGLNNFNIENKFVYTDGTAADFLPWASNQPDNRNNEDCVYIRGINQEGQKLDRHYCMVLKHFICKKAQRQELLPQAPTSGPGWNEKCGSWEADPFNNFCYLFNFLSMRTWAEALVDCMNQGGDLLSITDIFQQSFIQVVFQKSPSTGTSLWMGGHGSMTRGWEWTDGSPFTYIHWETGNPGDHHRKDCLSIRINNGYWNDDNCEYKRGYICKKKGRKPEPPPPHDDAITCARKSSFTIANDRMTVHCPAACAKANYQVYGTSVYRGDSNICAAAIHAGVIVDDIGGDCTLLKAPGQSFYPGSTRNGITSQQFDGNYEVSYVFDDGDVRCPSLDWYAFGNFCYRPYADKKTWHGAQSSCRKVGAELVSILSMLEQSWLESFLRQEASDVWTGLNYLLYTGLFMWSDTHLVTFTYWAPGQPSNHDGFSKSCVEMLQTTGRWKDVSCTKRNTYICKMPRAHYPVPSAQPTVYGCPQGWNAYGSSCYWMEETARSWTDAKTFCTDLDSFLVYVGDIFEQSYFTAMLSGKNGLWWISLRAQSAATHGVDYIWDNGAPLTFTHWDRNQPDNGDGTCVAMTGGQIGGFWDDQQCSEKFGFICEKARPDVTPPTEAPTPPPSQGCADSWTAPAHFRNCYMLFHNVDWSQKKSWQAAYNDCVSRGANLVSIHNLEEEEFLSLYSKGTTKWIGPRSNDTEGGYSWSDGSSLSHTNWGHGELHNHEGQKDCVEMVSSTNGTYSEWNHKNCDAHNDWICMISKGKNPILPPPVPAPDCGSNPGWRKNNNFCYYYNCTDVVDFHMAMNRCNAEKATLVSIHSEDEQAYVDTMVGTGNVAWIGMRTTGLANGQYMWVDISPVSYTHWAPGEPNNAAGEEQCVQMNQGGWSEANCVQTGGYVCKKQLPGDNHTPPPATQPREGNCPGGWNHVNNKCFLFDDIQANWSYAQSWCKEHGGDLAVIDNQYENDYVSNFSMDFALPIWIGLSDLLVENQYAWSDRVSPVLYTNWNDEEPNNAGGAERCVALTYNRLFGGKWNVDACHKDQHFMCSRNIPISSP